MRNEYQTIEMKLVPNMPLTPLITTRVESNRKAYDNSLHYQYKLNSVTLNLRLPFHIYLQQGFKQFITEIIMYRF